MGIKTLVSSIGSWILKEKRNYLKYPFLPIFSVFTEISVPRFHALGEKTEGFEPGKGHFLSKRDRQDKFTEYIL